MNTRTSKFRTGLLLTGLLTAVAAAPALAQSVVKPEPYAYGYETNEIVVVPYGIVRRAVERSPGSVLREEELSLSRVVSTDGLDLRYDPDVEALNQRVEYTARQICEELDRATVGDLTSDRECFRDAVRAAEPQVEQAVWRARTYASLK